jgi:hypothetical protein
MTAHWAFTQEVMKNLDFKPKPFVKIWLLSINLKKLS